MPFKALFAACLFGLCELFGGGGGLEYRISGEVLRVDGVIGSRSARQFERVLAEYPQIRVVVLGDVPGALDQEAVVDLGYVIRDRGLATHLTATSQVFSGGVDVFLAGRQRSVEPGGVLGVHEWQSAYGSGRDYPRGAHQHEPTRGYIEDMLGSDAFYWFTLEAAAFEEVHVMSRAEMRAFGLLTQ